MKVLSIGDELALVKKDLDQYKESTVQMQNHSIQEINSLRLTHTKESSEFFELIGRHRSRLDEYRARIQNCED